MCRLNYVTDLYLLYVKFASNDYGQVKFFYGVFVASDSSIFTMEVNQEIEENGFLKASGSYRYKKFCP